MHNREGLSARMILQVITDWRMWPVYVLGLLHMSQSRLSPSLLTLTSDSLSSSRHAATDISHVIAPQPRVRHNGEQPTQHPVHRDWWCDAAARGLLQRNDEQPRRRDGHLANLGPPSSHRAVHVQLAHIAVGVLRCGHAHHWLPLRASDTSRLGVFKLVQRPDAHGLCLDLQYVCAGGSDDWRMYHLSLSRGRQH